MRSIFLRAFERAAVVRQNLIFRLWGQESIAGTALRVLRTIDS